MLGWGDSDDETILSRDELEQRFDVARVTKAPARFDETKLKWLNGKYIREMSVDELTARLEAHTGRTGLRGAVEISQEKIGTLDDFWPLAGFLFDGPRTDDEKAREKFLGEDAQRLLDGVRTRLAGLDPFETETVEAALRELPSELEAKPKAVFQAVRVALAGTTVSPGLFESVALLGKDETLRRIDLALEGIPA
ncbi:MAG: hypothetical protein PGN13_11100 [Patulibacter minatonensis]